MYRKQNEVLKGNKGQGAKRVGNVIEINGKKYDAATGKMLNTPAKTKKTTRPAQTGSSVDGVVRKKSVPARARSASAPKRTAKPVQKSKTLMRTTVKKPVAKPTRVASISKSKLGASSQRVRVAQSTQKNPHVSKFGTAESEGPRVVKKVQPMPVKKPAAASPATAKTSPVAQRTVANVGKTASAAVAKKKNVAAAKMIETALASATAHDQPKHAVQKRRHKIAHKLGISTRAIAISSTVLAGLLLGGFFAAQNVPNFSMRLAAARAGFDATLPAYSPSGFSYNGPIAYKAGQVTISFSSNTDDRSYELTQRASNWNSEALLSNFVSIDGDQYQSYEDRGRTLYIYDGSNATWVDNGIWYQIEGESRMTTDQLIRVAASM